MGISHLRGEPGWGHVSPHTVREAQDSSPGGRGPCGSACSLTPGRPLRLPRKSVSPLRVACELPISRPRGTVRWLGTRGSLVRTRVGVSSGASRPCRGRGEEGRAFNHHPPRSLAPRGAGRELTVPSALHFLSLLFVFTPLSPCFSGSFVLEHRRFLCCSLEGLSFRLLLGGWGCSVNLLYSCVALSLHQVENNI